jgi:uncharacterized protein (DUF488 family)
MTIYTIGHSRAPIERFLELLALPSVDLLVDVRSQPHSRFAPQFNRQALARSLACAGVTYHYLGDALGGRPKDPQFRLPDGTVEYGRLGQAPHYRRGLQELYGLAEQARLAIMCAEADFRHCHRYWLISRSLLSDGVKVCHITHASTLVDMDENEFSAVPDQLRLW